MSQQLTSVGGLSRAIRCLPGDVIAAANRLGVEPALLIDGRPLFGADDARRIIHELRGPISGGNIADRANHLS